MSDVCGVTTGGRTFTREEEDELRKDQSTSAIMNRARRDLGATGPDVALRGDDKSRRELADEQHVHVGALGAAHRLHTLVDVVHLAEFHAVEKVLEAAPKAGVGLVAAGAVGGLVLGVLHIKEAHEHGEQLKAAVAKDELHSALLTQLDLPQGYKTTQLERHDASRASDGAAMKYAGVFAHKEKALVATLQLHADRGIHAAQDFAASKKTKEAFLAESPAVAKAYAEDAAFRAGFDAHVWARERSPSEVAKLESGLACRDAGYNTAHINGRI